MGELHLWGVLIS